MGKKHLSTIFFFVTLGIVQVAHAAPCGSGGYPNPINFCDIPSFVLSLASGIIKITIPFAVLLIIVTGFKFVASSVRGDTKGVEDAKKLLLWTLIGTAIVVGASAIAYGFVNFAKSIK